jgi:hypothetical protein
LVVGRWRVGGRRNWLCFFVFGVGCGECKNAQRRKDGKKTAGRVIASSCLFLCSSIAGIGFALSFCEYRPANAAGGLVEGIENWLCFFIW